MLVIDAVADLLLGRPAAERIAQHIADQRAWELRASFSAYDATYLALAEALTDDGVPLLTADARFARAVGRHSVIDVVLAG